MWKQAGILKNVGNFSLLSGYKRVLVLPNVIVKNKLPFGIGFEASQPAQKGCFACATVTVNGCYAGALQGSVYRQLKGAALQF